jgi:uncharacterized protein involved in exopolysaccharide biosynthesis
MNREINLRPAARPEPKIAETEEFFNVGAIIATLWRSKMLIAGVALVAALIAVVALLRVQSVYTATTELQLLRSGTQVIDIANVVENRTLGDSDVLSELSVISSPVIMQRVAERLDLSRYKEFQYQESWVGTILGPIRRFAAGAARDTSGEDSAPAPTPNQIAAGYLANVVVVRQVGLSYVLQVDVTSEDPARAALIANTIAEEYLNQQVEDKLAASRRATDWLRDRVTELQRQLKAADAAVQTTRTAMSADRAPSETVVAQQISDLSSLMVRSRIAHADALTLKEQFDALISRSKYVSAAQVVESATLRDSGERLDTIQRQIALLEAENGDPTTLRRLRETETQLKDVLEGAARDISTGLQASVDVAEKNLQSIERSVADLESAYAEAAARASDLRARERELDTVQNVYQAFLTRSTEARERGSFQEPNARIIAAAATPNFPSAPRRGPLVVLAFIMGAAVASAAVLALDMRADSFKTAAAVERAAGVPVLASLPATRRANPDERREEARRLRVALVDRPGGRRVIAVAPCSPDGASGDVAAMLAEQSAEVGRTALLRADPLSVAGYAPANVEVLLLNELQAKMAERGGAPGAGSVVEALRAVYDVVVIECPPVLASAAVLSLATEADALVLSIRWSRTPRGAVRDSIERLSAVDVTIAGIALCDVDPEVAASYGYAGESLVRRSLTQRWRRT